jgi:hypothetical protein
MKTTSLATAKALYDRGVRVESDNYHVLEGNCKWAVRDKGNFKKLSNNRIETDRFTIMNYSYDCTFGKAAFYAYTLCELLDIIKENYSVDECGIAFNKQLPNDIIGHDICIYDLEENKNITEAAGLMLLWLIDNNYIDIESLNGGSD